MTQKIEQIIEDIQALEEDTQRELGRDLLDVLKDLQQFPGKTTLRQSVLGLIKNMPNPASKEECRFLINFPIAFMARLNPQEQRIAIGIALEKMKALSENDRRNILQYFKLVLPSYAPLITEALKY